MSLVRFGVLPPTAGAATSESMLDPYAGRRLAESLPHSFAGADGCNERGYTDMLWLVCDTATPPGTLLPTRFSEPKASSLRQRTNERPHIATGRLVWPRYR